MGFSRGEARSDLHFSKIALGGLWQGDKIGKQGDQLGGHCSGPGESDERERWWPGPGGDNGGGRNGQNLII